MLGSGGVFGFRPTYCPGRHEVLRFGLMIERGLCEAATSIREGKGSLKRYAGLDVSSFHTVPGSGHMVHQTNPEAVMAAIDEAFELAEA